MDILNDSLSWYGRVIHPPLVLVLCISGSLGHLLSIATLSRMLNPTNALLISMSCCQLALCANFLYSTLFKWASDELCSPLFFSRPMATTMHMSVTLSFLVHIAGVFHVVALSIIRYFSLARLTGINSSVPWFTHAKCRIAILIIFVSVVVVGLPLYFTTDVKEHDEKTGCAERFSELRNFTSYELSLTENETLFLVNIWLHSLFGKIIPSTILCAMTLLILRALDKIRKMSARFSTMERDQQYQRTTKMILIIMFIFIVVELPQGIMAVLSTVAPLGHIDQLFGDINEMLTLLASCLIFFLFCTMNGRLRKALLGAPCFAWIEHLLNAPKKRSRLRTGGKDHLLLSGLDLRSCNVSHPTQNTIPPVEKNGYVAMPCG